MENLPLVEAVGDQPRIGGQQEHRQELQARGDAEREAEPPESSSTSQSCATRCIQVPMLENEPGQISAVVALEAVNMPPAEVWPEVLRPRDQRGWWSARCRCSCLIQSFQDAYGVAQHLAIGRVEFGCGCQPLVPPPTVRKQHLTTGVGEGHQALPMVARIWTAGDIATLLQTVDDAGHGRRLHPLLRGQFTHQLITGVEQHAHGRAGWNSGPASRPASAAAGEPIA